MKGRTHHWSLCLLLACILSDAGAYQQGTYFIVDLRETKTLEPPSGAKGVSAKIESLSQKATASKQSTTPKKSEFEIEFHPFGRGFATEFSTQAPQFQILENEPKEASFESDSFLKKSTASPFK